MTWEAWSPESGAGGFIRDGSDPPLTTYDAYDGFGALRIGGTGIASSAPVYYPGIGATDCGTEEGGQEVTFPARTVATNFSVSRKVYVPSSGLGFARFLDIVTNTSGSTQNLVVSYEGVVGSFTNTEVFDTSPGSNPNRWMTSDYEPSSPPSPPLAHVWDGPGSSLGNPAYWATGVWGGDTGEQSWPSFGIGQARVRAVYGDPTGLTDFPDMTIPAGATFVFMHFEAQRTTRSAALTAARTLGEVTAGNGFVGMAQSEIDNLKNWNPNDLDGDGKTPAEEAALGTSATNSDTDGDGISDGVDACPVTAGSGSNGCAASGGGGGSSPGGTTPPSSGSKDTKPPSLTLTVSRKVKLKAFLKGLTVLAKINEPASIELKLMTTPPRKKTFTKLLKKQVLPSSGAGTRATRLKPPKKRVGKATKLVVKLVATATDRAGNRTVRTVTIKIR